ncbi:MAG: helix-turn-helix transcriptional regulator [bacterium]|nr:helix-turn-helix transcriptional regulator [bacterium]
MKKEEFLKEIGSKIKNLRAEKKMSQIQLASLCQFDKASMSRIESGQANPTIQTLYKISEALEIPIPHLFKTDK